MGDADGKVVGDDAQAVHDVGAVVAPGEDDDDADDLLRGNATVAQTLGQHVRIEIVLAGILLDSLALCLADARAVFQRPADCGHADAQLAGNILHRDVLFLVHVVSVCVAKIIKI